MKLRLIHAVAGLAAIVAAGTATAGLPGSPDPSFGTTAPGVPGGAVVTDFGNGDAQAHAVAVQSDGAIVAVGYATVPGEGQDFALARYLPDGTLDTSFGPGSTGMVTTDVTSGADDQAADVVIQPDGRIVVAGYTTLPGPKKQFAVARYTKSGVPDTTFNGSGQYVTSFTTDAEGTAMALQLDGKIVVAGTVSNGNDNDFAVLRLNSDGTPDTNFGTNGVVKTPFGAAQSSTTYDDYAQSIAVDLDGTITVSGYTVIHTTTGGTAIPDNDDVAIAHYNPDGSPDINFGNNGHEVISLNSSKDQSYAVALQPDGDIVFAGGYQATGVNNFVLGRVAPQGSPDSSFGTGSPIAGTTGTDVSGGSDHAYAVALQPDGAVIAAGFATPATNSVFALVRYSATGLLDTGFGGVNGDKQGTVTLPIGSGDSAIQAIALQPDGKVVAAGYATTGSGNSEFALARFLATDSNSWGVTPAPLGFIDDNAASIGVDTSNQITLSGLGAGVSVPITVDANGQYSICGDVPGNCSFTSAMGWGRNGDPLYVQQTVSGNHGDHVSTTLTAGGLVAANNYSVILGGRTAGTFTSTVNAAPAISGAPGTSIKAGLNYFFVPVVLDDDYQPKVFSIQNKPTWASFSTITGQLTGTPTGIDVGQNPGIVISVTDQYNATASLPAFTLAVTAASAPAPTPSTSGGGGGGTTAPSVLAVLALAATLRRVRRPR